MKNDDGQNLIFKKSKKNFRYFHEIFLKILTRGFRILFECSIHFLIFLSSNITF